MAAFDSTTISGIATAAATVAAAVLLRAGRRSGKRQEDDEDATIPEGVSLTKQLMDEQRHDFRERIAELEAETRHLRGSLDDCRIERDNLLHELNYAHKRNQELGGP